MKGTRQNTNPITEVKNITNGKIFTAPNNFRDNWHLGYHGDAGQHKLQIDLGSSKYIDKIVLHARWHSGGEFTRIWGTSVELLDENKKVVRGLTTGAWSNDDTYMKEFLLN